MTSSTTGSAGRATKASFFGIVLAVATAAASPPALAQTPDELNAARALFRDAYNDEQEKRYDQALEKFQRVAKVRESASVRYRIGSVLEALGRVREARDSFRALAAQRDTLEKKEQDTADSAAERAREVDKKIPRLVVKTPADAPADTRVTVDGAAVPPGRLLELDPGDHVVQASAAGMKPFESHVTLGEGGETPFAVTLEPAARPAAAPPEEREPNKTLAYAAIGAGGALLVTGVVLLVVRAGDIRTIEDTCPGDVCPRSTQVDIQSKQDQAKLFGPLGIGLGVAGAAVAGVGVYVLVKKPSASSPPATTAAPTSPPAGALRVAPQVVCGGAMLGAGMSF